MHLKRMLVAATAAVALGNAAATVTAPVEVTSSPFTDVLLGQVTLTGVSDVDGFAYYVSELTATAPGLGTFTIPYATVSFSGGAFGTYVDSDLSDGFHFSNVAAGTYDIKVSGTYVGATKALIGASYTVTPVPEPESYAMFLAGLGALGFMARRRTPR